MGRAKGSTSNREKGILTEGDTDAWQAIPGVDAAAVVNDLPLPGESRVHFTVEAEGAPSDTG